MGDRRITTWLTRWPLVGFVFRRLLVAVALVVIASLGIFSLLYLAPGDVITNLLGLRPRTPDLVQTLREQYHLNDSFWHQYERWAVDAVQLKFGTSIQTTLPVSDEIKSRLPVSLLLGLYAYVLTLSIGLSAGFVAAFRRRRLADRTVVAVSVIGLSTPAFVSGIFLLYVFAVRLKWLPAFGRGSGFGDELKHLTLPAFALAFTCTAFVVKHSRASLMNVLDQDYVTFARARGIATWRMALTYYLRNAFIPIISISTPLIAYMIAGAVLVETTFSVPGMGQLLVQATSVKDIPVVQAIAIVFAAIIMGLNLLTDVLYAIVDPRIRVGRRSR